MALLIWNIAAYNTPAQSPSFNYSNEVSMLSTTQNISLKPIAAANQNDLSMLTYAIDSNRWNRYTISLTKNPQDFIASVGKNGRIYREEADPTQASFNATPGVLINYWGLNDSALFIAIKYQEKYLAPNENAIITNQTANHISFHHGKDIALCFPLVASGIWIVIICIYLWVRRKK
jgi:hypothetical protein